MDNNLTNESAEKKNYELSFLVKNEGDVREISRLLAQHGVGIKGEGPLKKLELAYEIKHSPYAYFGFMNFAGSPSEVKSLERDLTTNAAVLRALIVKLPKERISAVTEPKKPAKPATWRKPLGTEASRPPRPLSNEAIEKKIEEILQ